jgi:zinc transporter ZupT
MTPFSSSTSRSAATRASLERLYKDWSSGGVRVLAVAARDVPSRDVYGREDERDLEFLGFLAFLDRPKEGVGAALEGLGRLGVSVKLITGDNRLVARHVALSVGLRSERLLTGRQLDRLNDEALWHAAERTDLFVEVDPRQKEDVWRSRKQGIVGFLVTASATPRPCTRPTSASVDHAADVAGTRRFRLLKPHLDVIRRGIQETAAPSNTLKYVMTTTSITSATWSAWRRPRCSFLPARWPARCSQQFLVGHPALGLASDSVDELVDRPRRWDVIGKFMVEFGLLSSLFDLLTFAALLWAFHAAAETFRTAWFVESLLTELAVALVVRTRRRFYESRPGRLLLGSTLAMIPWPSPCPTFPSPGCSASFPYPALSSCRSPWLRRLCRRRQQQTTVLSRPAVVRGSGASSASWPSAVSLIGLAALGTDEARVRRLAARFMSFAAGALLGDAFLHLVPETLSSGGRLRGPLLIVAGILLFFLLERVLRQRHSAGHVHRFLHEASRPELAEINLAGDAVHNFIDGLVIGATTSVPALGAYPRPCSCTNTAGLGDFGILIHSGLSVRRATWLNAASASAAILGTAVALAAGTIAREQVVAALVPLAAGGFVYLAAAGLMPELQHERAPRAGLEQLALMAAGVAVMAALTLIE